MLQHMPLELTEAILGHLDDGSLRKTLRTARFLLYPSEKRLYYTVCLSTESTNGLGDRQAHFLDTIIRNSRLGHHVVKLVMGRCVPAGGDPRVNTIIGQAMKNMINLKELKIFGYPYILRAQLDSVPFSLTRLIMSGEKINDTDNLPPLVSILQVHPNLEELGLDCPEPPSDLIAVLKADEEGTAPASEVLCPRLRKFDGYDEGMRLFLPMRMIESGTTMGSGVKDIEGEDLADVWLTPALIKSYAHLCVLEVWTDREKDTCFLSTIAPYLTSLTHIQILVSFFALQTADHLLLSLGQMPALRSVTLTTVLGGNWIPESTARDRVELICSVCPGVTEIFIGGDEDPADVMYYGYTKGKGLQSSLVSQEVACRPYAKWLRES